MGRNCRVCGRHLPNERFSGKGRRSRVCKTCTQRPAAVRELILASQEIGGFLEQSNISPKNIARLEALVSSEIKELASMAQLTLEAARMYPRKRQRIQRMAVSHPRLLQQLEAEDLVTIDYTTIEHDWLDALEELPWESG